MPNGMSIEWGVEAGPRIVGHGVAISATESAALLDRWSKWFPKFQKKHKTKGFDVHNLLASLHACGDTYNRIPEEDEMKDLKTELARKFDLFFAFTMHMGAGIRQRRK
jgi:hypothetical protein